jgi:hypothetical protein
VDEAADHVAIDPVGENEEILGCAVWSLARIPGARHCSAVRRLTVMGGPRQSLATEALTERLSVLRLGEAEHTTWSPSPRRKEYVNCAADKVAATL